MRRAFFLGSVLFLIGCTTAHEEMAKFSVNREQAYLKATVFPPLQLPSHVPPPVQVDLYPLPELSQGPVQLSPIDLHPPAVVLNK